jgi:fibronectin type 3 domain-containing protein
MRSQKLNKIFQKGILKSIRIGQVLILLAFVLCSVNIRAQDTSSVVPKIEIKYHIIAKTYPDSIVIRFAPTSPNALPAHLERGISIDQRTVKGKYPYKISEWKNITGKPLKPWPLEAFNTEEYKKNKDMLLVAQALYGNIPSTKTDMIGRVKEQAEALSNLFYLSLLSADYNVMAANSYGLRFVLKTKIKPDEKIFFRIYSNFNHPLFKADTTMTFVTYGEWEANNDPDLLFISNKERAVELKWPVNKELYRWAGFNIERSENGTDFKRINKNPYLVFRNDTKYDATYVDSLAQNYKKYYYRIQAIDPFGDLTGYSQTVEGYGIDMTPPGGVDLRERSDNGNGITLSWSFLDKAPSDLKQFVIKKGNSVNNLTDTIAVLKPGTLTYFYPEKAKVHSTYFEVHAVDTAGNVRISNAVRYFLPDTEPPLPPRNFKAAIDSNGVVTLKWSLDTLDELIGYRVYRKNSADHKFVCLQEGYLKDTIYHDTLNLKTLTDEIFYSVRAIDLSYNHGKLTEPARLVKPDKIPPFPPNIVDYLVSDGKVKFSWTRSPSEDVTSYSIYRKDQNTNTAALIKKDLKPDELAFSDEKLKNGMMYEYTIVATDDAGLRSEPSFPLTIKAYTNKIVDEIIIKKLGETGKVGIEWTPPATKPLYYIIYKDNGEGLQQYANANSNETRFLDKSNSTVKNYGLQAIYTDQVKSEIFTLIKN